MLRPKMYYEAEKGIFHCEAAGGPDYTLCGFSLDGDQGEIVEATGRGFKINCGDCLGIIRFCRSVRQDSLSR